MGKKRESPPFFKRKAALKKNERKGSRKCELAAVDFRAEKRTKKGPPFFLRPPKLTDREEGNVISFIQKRERVSYSFSIRQKGGEKIEVQS